MIRRIGGARAGGGRRCILGIPQWVSTLIRVHPDRVRYEDPYFQAYLRRDDLRRDYRRREFLHRERFRRYLSQKKLTKPPHVTTSKPQLAPEIGMIKKRLDFKAASLPACSERDSEFDIQDEKLSKPDDVTTSKPRIAKQLLSISKMRFFLLHKHKALEHKKKNKKKKKNLKTT